MAAASTREQRPGILSRLLDSIPYVKKLRIENYRLSEAVKSAGLGATAERTPVTSQSPAAQVQHLGATLMNLFKSGIEHEDNEIKQHIKAITGGLSPLLKGLKNTLDLIPEMPAARKKEVLEEFKGELEGVIRELRNLKEYEAKGNLFTNVENEQAAAQVHRLTRAVEKVLEEKEHLRLARANYGVCLNEDGSLNVQAYASTKANFRKDSPVLFYLERIKQEKEKQTARGEKWARDINRMNLDEVEQLLAPLIQRQNKLRTAGTSNRTT